MLSLVFSVPFVTAHVIITWFVVPRFAVVSTEIRVGHSKFDQYLY